MTAVNASNKYTPFWQYEMINYGSQQKARLALFGELSDDEIWTDFLTWLDLDHTGRNFDPHLISRATARLNLEVGLSNLESKIKRWFLSTKHEHRQYILDAFLHGLRWDHFT